MSLSFQTMAAIRFGYGFRPGEAPPQNKDQLLGQVTDAALRARRPFRPAASMDAISRLSICRSGSGSCARAAATMSCAEKGAKRSRSRCSRDSSATPTRG